MVTATTVCTECRSTLTLRVCKSAAGHYLGYICPKDGPYDRVTAYMTEGRAKYVLKHLCLLTDPSVRRA